LVLTAANLVSVVAGLRVAGALRIRETAFSHPMGVLKLFLACMSASALAGLAGVVVGRLLFDMAGPPAFGYWMSAELVCYLSLLPAVLLAPVPGALPTPRPGRRPGSPAGVSARPRSPAWRSRCSRPRGWAARAR